MSKMGRLQQAVKDSGGRGITIPDLRIELDMYYQHIRNYLVILMDSKLVRRTGRGYINDLHRYYWITKQ